MKRDAIRQRVNVARMTLAIGAAVHCAACIPLYGRRGFPEVDPFWLAMLWLWIPPILISSVFDRWSLSRRRDLLLYALVTGFTLSWGTVLSVPSYKHAVHALWGLVVFWPLQTVCTIVVELCCQFVMRRLRTFPPRDRCGCGYSLRALKSGRCPECGTAFAEDRITNGKVVFTSVFRRWTTLLIFLTIIITAAFPLAYHHGRLFILDRRGSAQAESDWANGTAVWYVSREAANEAREAGVDFEYGSTDEATGLAIDRPFAGDWQSRTWEDSYQRVIEEKLREARLKPPAPTVRLE